MPEALIRVENVTKVYGSGAASAAALSGVCLQVERGSWLAIMGPSGHGKSTLLQIMGGLDRPTSGQVHLDDMELSNLGPAKLARTRARAIGFVFQFFNLLPHLTALENIELALWFGGKRSDEGRARAITLLDSVGLADKAHLPPGALSGGQQQRVAVARALANEPEILLMDEPTGNLDSTSEADLLKLLGSLHEHGRTIVMVTHNLAVAEHAQRVVHVKDGRIERDRFSGD
ncbi:MAG: ABC transporter ATP-binding protein [Burkholderiales bacterium]|jgi:putative ABC transport system ATP-binding protein|nr:ABC transporter ATP-binding protein [Burkholderiales bacterium]